MLILITDQNFGDDARVERDLIAGTEHELVVATCSDEDDVVAAIEAHSPDVIVVQFAPIGARAIARATALRGVVRYGIGVDNIDLAAAAERGVKVARVADYCVDEVADHTLALVLALERHVVELATATAAGAWSFRAGGPIRRLRGLTFGLLGFGQIGRAVAERAHGFGFRLIAHDPGLGDDEIRAHRVEPVDFDTLTAQADILSLHVPLSPATRGIVGRDALRRLKRNAVVVNTARGGLVDEAAVADALVARTVGAVALDVFEQEPPDPAAPLSSAPHLLVTPHAAWYSETAIVELREKAVDAALMLLRGETPAGLVTA